MKLSLACLLTAIAACSYSLQTSAGDGPHLGGHSSASPA